MFNSSIRIIEESANVTFNENIINESGKGPNWLFDIDALTTSLSFSDKFPIETDELFKEGQVKDTQQEVVLFPIPTIDPLEFCHADQED